MPPKDAFARLLDGLQTLMKEHLALARAEAKDELRSLVRDLAVSAAGVPLLLTGYILLMMALGLLLAFAVPQWLAFAIVAAANLALGGLLTFVWGRRMATQRHGMTATGQELSRDKQWLAQLKSTTAAKEPAPLPAALQASPQQAGSRP
jgi:uncharacterized membrane protein YqjE